MTFEYQLTPEEVSRAQSAVLRAGYGSVNSRCKFWTIILSNFAIHLWSL